MFNGTFGLSVWFASVFLILTFLTEKQGFLPGLNLQQLEHHHQSPTSPQPQKTHVTSRQSLECRPRPPIPPKPRLASVTSPSKLKHSNVVDLTTNTQFSTNVNLSQSQRLMLQNGIQATPRGMEDLPYKTKTAAKPHLQKSIPSRPDDSKVRIGSRVRMS